MVVELRYPTQIACLALTRPVLHRLGFGNLDVVGTVEVMAMGVTSPPGLRIRTWVLCDCLGYYAGTGMPMFRTVDAVQRAVRRSCETAEIVTAQIDDFDLDRVTLPTRASNRGALFKNGIPHAGSGTDRAVPYATDRIDLDPLPSVDTAFLLIAMQEQDLSLSSPVYLTLDLGLRTLYARFVQNKNKWLLPSLDISDSEAN